jgi:hypothetical protein
VKQYNLTVVILVAVAASALAFFGGMKYQQSQTQRAFGLQNGGAGTFGFAGRMGGQTGAGGMMNGGQRTGRMRPVMGSVVKSDTTSITVQLADGSTKVVLYGASTQINKAQAATKADLTAGQKVAIFGNTNADGSVTAQMVQLNPQQYGAQDAVSPTAAVPTK